MRTPHCIIPYSIPGEILDTMRTPAYSLFTLHIFTCPHLLEITVRISLRLVGISIKSSFNLMIRIRPQSIHNSNMPPKAAQYDEEEGIRLKLVDGQGEEFLFRIGKSTTPLSLLFREFSKRNKIPLNALQFTYNDKVLPAACRRTPALYDMIDGDKIYAKVANNLPPININFISGDGDVMDFRAKCNIEICHLFEDYSARRNIPLILLHFSYRGNILPPNCNATVSRLGITDGGTIYAEAKFPCGKIIEKVTVQLESTVHNADPRSFLRQKVARYSGGVVKHGTIMDYVENERVSYWVIEFPGEIKLHYSKTALIRGLRYHYKKKVLHDFVAHVEKERTRHMSEVKCNSDKAKCQLKNRIIGKADEIILETLRIEGNVERILNLTLRTPSYHDDFPAPKSMKLLKKQLIMTRQALMTDKVMCKVKKPMLEAGDIVRAKWWPNSDRGDNFSFKTGVIKSYKEYGDTGGYGPCRVYGVLFDNGDYLDDIADYQVRCESYGDVLLEDLSSIPIGVKPEFDYDSDDPWAYKRGWFVATIDGVEVPFTFLSDALRAYDAHAVGSKGFEIGESDLNLAEDWAEFITMAASPEERASEADSKAEQTLRFRVMLTNERLVDANMKQIGRALICWTLPNSSWMHMHSYEERSYHDKGESFYFNDGRSIIFQEELGYYWKEAFGHGMDGNETLIKDSLFKFSLLRQCVIDRISLAQISHYFISAEGKFDEFLRKVPIFCEGYNSISSQQDVLAYLIDNAPALRDDYMSMIINTVDENGNSSQRYTLPTGPFKYFLARYAADRHTSVKSLRIELNGKRLFLSDIGIKSPAYWGLEDNDVIKISIMQPLLAETTAQEQPAKSKRPKGKKNKKCNRKKAIQPKPPEDEEEKLRKLWMDAISHVFVEADPTFRSIRQRLNAMNLQRTKPKQKKNQTTAEPVDEHVNHHPEDGLCGKAGKSRFIIQVGEVSNLYKTTKPSAMHSHSYEQVRSDDIMIDLHGLTKEEATTKLDMCLPEWVDIAMNGSYPWVIPVKIVCGGGSQIIAEAVENWIKQNDNVANAPKNLYS